MPVLDAALLEPRVLFSAAPFDSSLDLVPEIHADTEGPVREVGLAIGATSDRFCLDDPVDGCEISFRIDGLIPTAAEEKELVFVDVDVPELERLLIDLRDSGSKERDFDVIL